MDIETKDLPSYIPGYDDYLLQCEKDYDYDDYDYYDEYQEEKLREEYEKMERNIIDLSNTNMTFDEINQLENYVWKDNFLIPEEKIGE